MKCCCSTCSILTSAICRWKATSGFAIFSDLFDDLTRIMDGLDHLRFMNHEVLLFHVFDPYERDLPLEGNIRFRDLQRSVRRPDANHGRARSPAVYEP